MATEEPEPSAEYNVKILSSLARWVVKKHDNAKLVELARDAGMDLNLADIDGATKWLSGTQVEKFLSGARELVDTDGAFLRACGEYFPESLGPVRYMVWALSERQFFEGAEKMSKLMLRVGKFETLLSERARFHVRYTSERKESRLMCLSRQASFIYGPAMWGMPLAQLVETACIAQGDAYCEYHLRWFERRRMLPSIAGVLVGGAAATGIAGGHFDWRLHVLLPLLGAVLGYLYELRRIQRANLDLADEVNDALRDLGRTEAEARLEIIALHQRQRDWIGLMEQQVTERTSTLEKIVSGIDDIQQNRVSTLRGFSHDLRNPLFVVRGNAQFLIEKFKTGEEGEALRDMDQAAAQIEAMLARLMDVATQDTGFVKLSPKPVKIPPLADTFRRRLKALVHGRDIKVSVFCTREAPEEILVDPVVFDRVVDNMLTNAAKYTHRGSIVLELGGTPATGNTSGFFTLKLSDTGEGIPPDQVERIFRPRPSNEPAKPNSYGIGLSSVVRLLAQIGGRIDVMSKPGVGTTFWGHFPVDAPEQKRVAGEDNLESMIMRVVTIRKAEGT